MTDLTALTEITAPTTDDLVYVVDAPTGAKNPRKCSIANFHAVNDARTKTLTNTTIDADGTGNSITNIENADIKSSAAIAYSKLNLTGAVVDGDLAGSIANGKLATNPLLYSNMTAPTASVAFNSQKLTGLANGVASTDAATKGQLDTAVSSDITLKGAYNANTNSPNLDSSPSAGTILKGDHYVVSVAGTFYSEALQEGDSLISEVDNPSAIGDWIITNSQIVTPIVTANIADEAVTEGKLYISNAGNNGEFLSKQSGNNGGLTWATVPAGYNAPTIGSTSIGSGATVTTIAGLTLSSPTLTTPALGTPSAGVLTSCTGLPIGGLVTTGTANNSTFLRGDGAWSTVDSSPLTTKGDVYVYGSANTRIGVGSDGQVLKADSSTATGLAWGAGGGGATIVHTYSNTTNTSYTGTASSFGTVGAGDRDIYIKKIDANNEGVFTKIWKNGAAVEVQIA